MSPPDLSGEQAAAALAPLGDVCVSAGAGSGKTRVLTARFLHHVTAHGLPVRGIAALTFTEKAARQMRERIGEALEGALGPAARAESALAPVSTMHAFCARVLRRNAVAAGLDPAFRVLDETQMGLLREEARQRTAQRLGAHPQADGLWAALRRLPGVDPLRALSTLLARLRGTGRAPSELAWFAGGPTVAAALAAVEAAIRDVEREAAAMPVPPDPAPFVAVARAALAGDAVAYARMRSPSALFKPGGSKPFQALRDARDALGAAVATWAGAVLDEQGVALVPMLRLLLTLLDHEEQALKAERCGLDFDDLEQRTRALLEALEAAGRRPEGLPRALLVDEHQDTNPMQEELLARLRRLGLPQFSVGDPKQSIYRFRRADVRVLLAEQERVGAAGRRPLVETYRATAEVVAALNGLHEPLFAGGRAGVPFAPLRARGAFRPADAGDPPAVELALLTRAKSSADEGRRREAAFVAARLADLVGRGTRLRGGATPRTITYGDCAVLVRARAMLPFLERALAAAGVPCRVHRGRGYLEAEEVRSLVHALRVVHDPLDEHALACLVRGPALAATDARLLDWFGVEDPAGRPVPAWERLCADPGDDARGLVERIVGLRRLATGARLPEVVAAVVDRLGLFAAALAQRDGAPRAANLRRALTVAEEVARAGHHGLADLLAHVEDLATLDLPQTEAPALAGAGGEVDLLTIHAAKGLEWPVVVVADVTRHDRAQGDVIHVDGAGRAAFRLHDPLEGGDASSSGHRELQEREDAAAEAESLRLLYVASTRAVQHLLLTGSFQPTKEGRLAKNTGWARTLADALALRLDPGRREIPLGAGSLCVTVAPAPEEREAPAAPTPDPGPSAPDAAAEADARLAALGTRVAPLGGTRFVVAVSELMAFARSPAALYRRRLAAEESGAPGAVAPNAEVAPDAEVEPAPAADPEGRGARRAERAAWDEPDPEPGRSGEVPLDRAALGRAVHALLERWAPGREPDVGAALAEEYPGAPPAAHAAAATMGARFASSALAARLAAALRRGDDVRREVAFHARVRFPAGARVGPFDALLVKGTIDLWLPEEGGVRLVDHKTNAPSRAHPTAASLAEHYAWQLRLYALAAERLLGRDVAGASLLLLDPAWGPAAVEVPVDVSGAALEETRGLCRAFALAERDDRWPEDWRGLLGV